MKSNTKNQIKSSSAYKLFTIINYSFLVILGIVSFYPLLHVMMSSISDGLSLSSHSGLVLLPIGQINFEAYRAVFTNPNILNGYKNTLIILIGGVTLQVFLTSMGAYVLSRNQFKLRNTIMFFITFTMFFQGGMIPFYLVVKNLNLTNSLLSLVIPFSVSAYNLIIMRTSFAAIPKSLEESAMIDGANHWTIFTKIMMPLNKATVAVMVLYYGVGIWNGWFWASVFISDRSLYPLQLVLRGILLSNDVSTMTQGISDVDAMSIADTIKYATIMIATVPILFVYPFLQKYFAKGVMIGSVKG